MLGSQRLMCTCIEFNTIIILNPELFNYRFKTRTRDDEFHDRVMRVSPAAVEVASQSVLSFALSRKNQYNSKHAMSEPNHAKSIAWTRFPLELDTFEEFATAVLQTLAKRCLTSRDQHKF